MNFRMAGFFTGLLAIASSSMIAAQETPEPPRQELPPEVQQVVQELQQVQAQLAPIHSQAMEDEAIQREQEEVAQAVRTALNSQPGMEGQIDRMEELMREAQEAQASGNAERIQELQAEANQIQPAIEAAEQRVLEDPEIQARVNGLQERLRTRMIEIDPDAEELLDRHDELQQRLVNAAQEAGLQ